MKYKDNNLSGVTSPQVDILFNVISSISTTHREVYKYTPRPSGWGISILYRGPKKEMRYGAEF